MSEHIPVELSNDAMIEKNIRENLPNIHDGKWLRFQRSRPKLLDHGGPKEYHMLPYYELTETPTVEEPYTIQYKEQMDLDMQAEYALCN